MTFFLLLNFFLLQADEFRSRWAILASVCEHTGNSESYDVGNLKPSTNTRQTFLFLFLLYVCSDFSEDLLFFFVRLPSASLSYYTDDIFKIGTLLSSQPLSLFCSIKKRLVLSTDFLETLMTSSISFPCHFFLDCSNLLCVSNGNENKWFEKMLLTKTNLCFFKKGIDVTISWETIHQNYYFYYNYIINIISIIFVLATTWQKVVTAL